MEFNWLFSKFAWVFTNRTWDRLGSPSKIRDSTSFNLDSASAILLVRINNLRIKKSESVLISLGTPGSLPIPWYNFKAASKLPLISCNSASILKDPNVIQESGLSNLTRFRALIASGNASGLILAKSAFTLAIRKFRYFDNLISDLSFGNNSDISLIDSS